MPAPAYAVVVDKTDRNTVYVGTAVGVWRGVFDPGADPAWAALPCAWTAAVQTLLRNGGATPALVDGWSFADPAQAVRSPAGPIDARLSRVVTFDTDFSTLAATARVVLVAVVHSDADPVTLAGATLQAVVLGSRFVALRSTEVL